MENHISGRQPRQAGIVAAGLAVILLYFVLLPTVPLLEPDEGRYAEIPREMLASGDFITPHLNGLLYFEKPPLYFWLSAAAIATFGLNEFACRFWSATAGLATVALVFLLGTRLGGRRAGAWAAAVLASSPFVLLMAHFDSIDMTLTFFLTSALVCFAIAWDAPRTSRGWLSWYGVFASSALAVMTKGLIGVVIPGGIIVVTIALSGRWRVLRGVPWLSGTALFLLIAVPWHVVMANRHPDFLSFYFIHEHLLRYATSVAARSEPWWFFPAVLLVGLLPWSGAAIAAVLARGTHAWLDTARRRPELVLLAVWFALVLAFFSVSRSKLAPYVLPATPPVAVLLGVYLARLAERRESLLRAGRAAVAGAAVTAAALGAALIVAASGLVDWLGEQQRLEPLLMVLGAALVVMASLLCFRSWTAPPGALAGVLLLTAMSLSCALWVAVTVDGPKRSSKAAAEILRPRLRDGDLVFCLADYRQTLPVYLRQTVGVVSSACDLEFGLSHASADEMARRFPDVRHLSELWNSRKAVYVLVDRRDLAVADAAGLHGATRLLDGRRIVLLANPVAVGR